MTDSGAPRRATAAEINTVLREQSPRFLQFLELREAQLSIPVDGKGLRVKVSVRKGERPAYVGKVAWKIGEETVAIPLEIVEDYEEYSLL